MIRCGRSARRSAGAAARCWTDRLAGVLLLMHEWRGNTVLTAHNFAERPHEVRMEAESSARTGCRTCWTQEELTRTTTASSTSASTRSATAGSGSAASTTPCAARGHSACSAGLVEMRTASATSSGRTNSMAAS
jgi:hypothetical protein